MKVLAIETSCDETGIALVEGEKLAGGYTFAVKKAALLSQALLHAPYGGVYPNLAKREHEKNLPALFAEFKDEQYDAVAVTAGPGLEPALWTGIEFAKKLAKEKGVPLLPVNHMEGHLISSLARLENNKFQISNIKLPVLALLISGGHTELVLMKEWFEYQVIGRTLDDAAGEAFDKVARMLELPYPGGPHISRLATEARTKSQTSNIKLPRPMMHSGTCDFSFSGLKTAALYQLRDKTLTDEQKAAFAAEFEDSVGDVLVAKTKKALEDSGARTFVIGGGVAANKYLRERLQKLIGEKFDDVELRLPELSITGDNAVMIAQAALARALGGKQDAADDTLRAVGNLSIAG